MRSLWYLCPALLSLSAVAVCDVLEGALGLIGRCQFNDFDKCLQVKYVNALKRINKMEKLPLLGDMVLVRSNRTENTSFTEEERSEDSLTRELEEFVSTRTLVFEDVPVSEGRGHQYLRTYRRIQRYLMPLLLGVKLKLAAFLPLKIAVLAMIAKQAIFASKFAVLLSVGSIFMKYFYKLSSWKHTSGGSDIHRVYQVDHRYPGYALEPNYDYGYRHQSREFV